ncbi:MAG: DUF418 domain-containing protein [Acidobacteriota bacterium]|nr:DUF418 domain-containing protein [Acidobacteriota bacterium]
MTGRPRESLRPTRRRERIPSLDLLRGFALLGILIINIQVFSMISAAYLNPTAYGDLSGVNGWVYILSHVLADQKFMTLFTILYGAGIVLMTSRAEARGTSSAGIHYRRTFILLVIGLLHAYLLWAGDVLVSYALCALVVFPFRNLAPRTLLTLGLCSVLIASAIFLFTGLSLAYIPPDAIAEMTDNWKPSAELVQEEVAAYRSGWLKQMEERVGTALFLQTKGFLLWGLWRIGGLMLVGMALFKWGVLTAARSSRFYFGLATAGLTLGWILSSYGLVHNFARNWSLDCQFIGSQYNYWGSVPVSLGYLSIVMLICKSDLRGPLSQSVSAVGRTALSNYLLQTLLCTTLFYGHGFGLFGSVERTEQVAIVLAVWIVQLVASSWWVKRFRYGPLEWVWRSLTYWNLQPIR